MKNLIARLKSDNCANDDVDEAVTILEQLSNNAIVVTINVPLDIDFTHLIEQRLDIGLADIGFSRTGTSKNSDGSTTIKFYQFGVAL